MATWLNCEALWCDMGMLEAKHMVANTMQQILISLGHDIQLKLQHILAHGTLKKN